MGTRVLLVFYLLMVCSLPALAQTPATPGPTPAAPAAPAAPTPIPNTPLSLLNSSSQWRFEMIDANHLRTTGQVEMEVGPQVKFSADVIDVFTDPNLRLVATGNVVFTNPEGRIAA